MAFTGHTRIVARSGRLEWLVTLFALLTALALGGCQVESVAHTGCNTDDDCAEGRLCRIDVCWWPQDAEFVESHLLGLGQHLVQAIQEQTYEPLYDNFLSNSDILELFDYDRSAIVEVIATYDRTLITDFNGLLDNVPVTGCTVESVTAGEYVPIPAGEEHTVVGLLRLKNTSVRLLCAGESKTMEIANIVWHLQQWKILTLTSPAMLLR